MTKNLPQENIHELIYLIRGHKVMLSQHLAELYGVEPRVLVQAVKRNRSRFPFDFMFQLTKQEFENLKSQIVISSWGGLRRATPYAFTQEGVAMLSSVLRSHRAIKVNIMIMRAFVEMRRLLSTHRDMAKKVADHEKKITGLSNDVLQIFHLIQPLFDGPVKKIKRIGFKAKKK